MPIVKKYIGLWSNMRKKSERNYFFKSLNRKQKLHREVHCPLRRHVVVGKIVLVSAGKLYRHVAEFDQLGQLDSQRQSCPVAFFPVVGDIHFRNDTVTVLIFPLNLNGRLSK